MESGLKVLSVKKIASRHSRPQAKLVSDLGEAISDGNLLALPLPADAARDLMSRPWGLRHAGGPHAA